FHFLSGSPVGWTLQTIRAGSQQQPNRLVELLRRVVFVEMAGQHQLVANGLQTLEKRLGKFELDFEIAELFPTDEFVQSAALPRRVDGLILDPTEGENDVVGRERF